MNILMLSNDYLPNIGGIAAHIFHLSKALQSFGHHIVVVNSVAAHRDAAEFSTENGIGVLRIYYRKQQNKLGRRWGSTKAARQGVKLALEKHGPFDLIHQHDHIASTLAAATFAAELPWLWTNHTSDFLMDYDRPLKKRFVKWAYRKCAGIITASPERYEASMSLWQTNRPVAYIPNGVDTSRFEPNVKSSHEHFGLPVSDFTIVYPSRIAPVKGTLYLAQAVAHLIKLRPEVKWHFVFLGSNKADNTNFHYIDEVKRVLEPAHQKGHVSYLGNLPMEEMPKVNALADVVVMPSLMEAVSLSALEAMATRKPVIATNVGGLPEIIHHETTGLLVESKNPQALADAIIRLYDNAELRARIAEGGYRLATQSYSWRTIAEQTEGFYKHFVETSKQ